MCSRFYDNKGQAKYYKTFRPQYTRDVYDRIFQYCVDNGGKFRLAVDIGCGTGDQSTLPLLTRFKKVVGVDASAEQLKHAQDDEPKLTFRQSQAENLPFLDSGSVDLVTTATSVHWFNIPEFFQEVERVLTPGGCLAVYGYGMASLQEPEAQAILEEFTKTKLEEYNHEKMEMALSGYSTLHLPFPGYKRYNVECKLDWTVDRLCGYIASTGRWQRRLKAIPDCDSLDTLNNNLLTFYRKFTGQDCPRLIAVFPVAMLLGSKPVHQQ